MTSPTACPTCGTNPLRAPVPTTLGDHLSDGPSGFAVCPRCLRLDPIDDPVGSTPDLTTVSDALPTDPASALAVLVLVDLLSSLALNRRRIQAVSELLEGSGVDPLLALERLAADPTLEPGVDLATRIDQFEQLRE